MSWYKADDGFEAVNKLGSTKEPFLFVISYDKTKLFIQPLKDLDEDILYDIDGVQTKHTTTKKDTKLNITKTSFETYQNSFNKVIEEIKSGNTYLLNLTFQTPISTTSSLKDIFHNSNAKYKLYFKDIFTCFSPEPFVTIEKNLISTYPMKGTIDANILNAKAKILGDTKEMAEHTMIVDLMRNDLGIIGKNIEVENFRYIEKIKAGDKELLQVSSKVTANLENNWNEHLGDILNKLLPAGSITGTPKLKTTQIINKIENYERGFYTGIAGIFDGQKLNSFTLIRFIENQNGKLYYKSGGGITLDSNVEKEFEELNQKIYIPS